MQLAGNKVQTVHNELFQRPELSYHNFQVAQDGIHLTNLAQAPGQVSACSFQPDRTIFREEFRDGTMEDFATRVVNVLGIAWRTLGIAQSVGHQFWTRSLVAPQHVEDSRRFVVERMLSGGAGALETFGRPVHTTGVRFAFAQDGTRPAISLRVEPWVQEPRSLWIEVISQYQGPTTADNLPDLGAALYATYGFLTGPVLDYVQGFDTP